MDFLFRFKDLCLNFLFPKSRKVLELEALSTSKLLNALPQAEPIKDVMALFDYSHPLVKEMIWQLKYSGNAAIADKLGEILYDVLEQELADLSLFEKWGRPRLIPIPITDKRRFERGWNQSELLCERIKSRDTRQTFKYLPRQLAKLRHTESQTRTASRSERLENIKDSMKVLNEAKVAGECVIVIDDVTTTGATFNEARRALRAAGAKKILCIAVAH
ncbi:MAG: phosphoribosyltransferase family protein [bacterium]|nr:phosphoribosyltransferase family protein [bacterium]